MLVLVKRTVLALWILALAAAAAAEEAKTKATIVFMCPYGGAKSVIATSYFNRAAVAAGLEASAIAVAAETPYEAVPPAVAETLEADGFAVRDFRPRRATKDDLASAARVISIGCDLTKLDAAEGVTIDKWDDVPMVSADLPGSVAAIRAHVARLVEELSTRR